MSTNPYTVISSDGSATHVFSEIRKDADLVLSVLNAAVAYYGKPGYKVQNFNAFIEKKETGETLGLTISQFNGLLNRERAGFLSFCGQAFEFYSAVARLTFLATHSNFFTEIGMHESLKDDLRRALVRLLLNLDYVNFEFYTVCKGNKSASNPDITCKGVIISGYKRHISWDPTEKWVRTLAFLPFLFSG